MRDESGGVGGGCGGDREGREETERVEKLIPPRTTHPAHHPSGITVRQCKYAQLQRVVELLDILNMSSGFAA